MAIGERINFFRNMRGMTQKYLGMQVGFPEKSADVRLAQYESETRVPKEDTIERLSYIFDVSPLALKVPDIDTYNGLMHTLFVLEDTNYMHITKNEAGQYCIALDKYTENSKAHSTYPQNKEHRDLLEEMARRFDNSYLIDLNTYAPEYDEKFKENFFMHVHMTPAGYLFTADMIMSYIDYIVRNNMHDFDELAFIGTDVTNH